MNFRANSSSTLIWQSFAIVHRSKIRCQPLVCIMAIFISVCGYCLLDGFLLHVTVKLPVFRVRSSRLLQQREPVVSGSNRTEEK